jgi:hypothetical protein
MSMKCGNQPALCSSSRCVSVESRWTDTDRGKPKLTKAVPLHAMKALGGEEV